MLYTVYKITNNINGNTYIGVHKTKDINDNYMGSGKILKRAIKKYGVENFSKETIFIFDNPTDMYKKEYELVNKDFVMQENTYNLKIGGSGGWDYINDNITPEEKLLKDEARAKATREKMIMKYGDDWSKILNKLAHEKLRLKYGDNWGKVLHSRMIEMRKGKNFPNPFKGKKHTESAKKTIGQKNSKHQMGANNSQFGTMWVTDGVISMKIKKIDEIPLGFVKGRKC